MTHNVTELFCCRHNTSGNGECQTYVNQLSIIALPVKPGGK
jgi:hypothetical protein